MSWRGAPSSSISSSSPPTAAISPFSTAGAQAAGLVLSIVWIWALYRIFIRALTSQLKEFLEQRFEFFVRIEVNGQCPALLPRLERDLRPQACARPPLDIG